MLSELAECTMLMLQVIHEMYCTQRITYRKFVDHTYNKLHFLSENIEFIHSETKRKDAFDILCKCACVLSERKVQYLH
jgi:asparagine synthetase A